MAEGHGCGIGHGLHATMGVNWEKECPVGWGRRVGGPRRARGGRAEPALRRRRFVVRAVFGECSGEGMSLSRRARPVKRFI